MALVSFRTRVFDTSLENSNIFPMQAIPSPRIGARTPPHCCPRVSFAPEHSFVLRK